MWNTHNQLEKTKTTASFDTIIFCGKETSKEDLLHTLEILKLKPITETLIKETQGVFCAQIQDKDIETVKIKSINLELAY